MLNVTVPANATALPEVSRRSLLAGLAALPIGVGVAEAAAHPDATLFALEAQYLAVLPGQLAAREVQDAVGVRVMDTARELNPAAKPSTPEWSAALWAARTLLAAEETAATDHAERLTDEMFVILQEIADTRPSTLEGLFCKARCARWGSDETLDEAITPSLVQDLLTLAGTPDHTCLKAIDYRGFD